MSDAEKDLGAGPTPSDVQLAHKDLLLCIFIHGFKGTDSTFGDFPSRLCHILDSTISNVKSECIIFPVYETKGELNQATERFADWMTSLTVEREVAQGRGGGAGRARIVLCSHSMGGLVAADVCVNLAKFRADPKAPLWPNVIACISFDTPYLGLHPWVFKNSASKAFEYVNAAHSLATGLGFLRSTNSSPTPAKPAPPMITAPESSASGSKASEEKSWSRFLTPSAGYTVGGVLLATAAAGTAYYRRQDIENSVGWAQDHMKYVGTLWDEKRLNDRLTTLMKLSRTKDEGGEGIIFRNFYTLLPAKGRAHPQPRTFIILPQPKQGSDPNPADYFLAAVNNKADDEVSAHTGMFGASTNDGYYELGLGVVQLIRNALGEIPLSDTAAENIVEDEIRVHEAAPDSEPDAQLKNKDEVKPEEDLIQM